MRWFLLSCALVVVGCGSPPVGVVESSNVENAQPPVSAGPSDWPGFLGPFGNGTSSEKLKAPWPNEGLRLVWQAPIGEGYGGPVISRGKLFLFDRIQNQARLRCMESTTGKPLWQFEYPSQYEDNYGYEGGPRCCPVVDNDRVYIFGAEGMLHCVRAEDGKEVWKRDTQKEFNVRQNFFGVASTPVVEGDLLIVPVGGSPAGSEDKSFGELTGNGSGIVAFDKRTGAIRWKATDELASCASPTLATIDGRRWCFVLARGGLVGLDPANGKIDFHFPWRAKDLESVNASNPVVVGDHVFITECYGPGSALLKVKPGSYEEVWTDAAKGRDKAMQCHWNTPIYCDGYVYGSSGRDSSSAQLRCVELSTGKVMWSVRGLSRASLLMVDGHFICLGEYGELVLLKVNPQRYEEVSRMELGHRAKPKGLLTHPCWAAPVLSHGLLYLRGKGRLLCLEMG
ncbi:MAG: PQQ-like beta-propeller repeat protein [Gemmataceae bacterium]|nr:PQQ-like beta-propeller repeat protein [Gemmataceae bacterium]